jgi:hypothetical protein
MACGARLSALREAIEAQRRALIAGDVDSLVAGGQAVVEQIRAVQADGGARDGGARSPEESRELAEAAEALRVNALLLARSSAANARALAALFGPSSPTYEPGGAGRPVRSSRALDAA